jgi:hypothetical protein
MMRSLFTLIICLALVSSARATLSPVHRSSLHEREPRALVSSLPARIGDSPYRVTEQTEVKLNGRTCKFHEVPSTAKIILMEIDSDVSRNILRIHFQNRE